MSSNGEKRGSGKHAGDNLLRSPGVGFPLIYADFISSMKEQRLFGRKDCYLKAQITQIGLETAYLRNLFPAKEVRHFLILR